MASGDLSPLITEIGFEEIADGVRQLQEGTTTGRLVAKLAD
ncbi:MAG TPA: hypothetical protein VFV13_01435 [Acidimicrobiia bacterium]|nr:hypothetical protein [Acidimicrobiia bacterium]